MTTSAEQQKTAQREQWGRAAGAWARYDAWLDAAYEAVSSAMCDGAGVALCAWLHRGLLDIAAPGCQRRPGAVTCASEGASVASQRLRQAYGEVGEVHRARSSVVSSNSYSSLRLLRGTGRACGVFRECRGLGRTMA